jgi:Concanavalin A-like lectin/glucanases superfamily
MAVVSLQSSNVFSYSFIGQGNSHFNYLVAGNNNPILNIGGESWTIECWIKPVGYSVAGANYQSIFAKRGATIYQGYLTATNGYIGYYNGANYEGTRVTPNVWNHVAWVFNQGANLRIFLNGTNVMTTTAVTSVGNSDTRLHIGLNPGENSQFFGDISNFRIIKGQALYSGNFGISRFPIQLPNNAIGPHAGTTNVAASLTGNVIFLTCNDQTIKSNGNTIINTFTTNGFVHPHLVEPTELQNFSYYFDPTQNDTVLVTSTSNVLNLNADFTIEMWYYPLSNSGVILERGMGGVGNNNASYVFIWDTPNNNINFAVANANSNPYSVGALTGAAGSLGTVTLNTWNHIAVTRTGTTYRGFLNGSLNFTPGTNANVPYGAIGRGITIGGMFQNGQTYAAGIPANTISGYISNIRIVRGASLYNAAFTPQQSQPQLLALGGLDGTALLTGLTPVYEDLTANHTIAANGMGTIPFSPFSPYTANAVANANATTLILENAATGREQGKIQNKFDYQNFGQVINIYPALAYEQGRIYDKIESAEFAFTAPIFNTIGQKQSKIIDKIESTDFVISVPIYNTIGQDQGRIYDKIESAEFAYIPTGGVGGPTGNIEYQFWS